MPPMLLPHWPNPQRHLPSLCSCNALKMRIQCHFPISALTTPYASTPLPLTNLMLLQHPQDMPPTLPSTPLMPNPLSAA
ncbi:hypothetical protein O181_019438 [Austropuccinia psidii MF-1]|uniref:Uncharacterized protein n=1 Tax=Austropuccinia psidii MF-1 TaxID=1389203 RepID=A0A9Q3GTL2_9BASI|nr:hypothetical protein [Austropuccinia psidii MF-1]